MRSSKRIEIAQKNAEDWVDKHRNENGVATIEGGMVLQLVSIIEELKEQRDNLLGKSFPDDKEADRLGRIALEKVHLLRESGRATPYVVALPKGTSMPYGLKQSMWPIMVGIEVAMQSRTESGSGNPCQEKTHSWNHYKPEQIDSYEIHCDLYGKHHDEHHNSETGLSWKS